MDFMDLLADPAYRHVLLNHVPIIGLLVAMLVLLAGLVARQVALQFTGLALIALTAGSTVLVVRYGDAAYPAIFNDLDGHARAWLDHHADLAETWVPALYASAALAVLALVAGLLRRPLLPWASLLVALLAGVALYGAIIVASAGGKIQHPEFRISDPPAAGPG